MKPRRSIGNLLIAGLCLPLGAATTVGVAWWVGHPDRLTRALRSESATLQQRVFDEWVGPAYRIGGASWEIHGIPSWTMGKEPRETVVEAGWPLKALRSTCRLKPAYNSADRPWRFRSWHEGVEVPRLWHLAHPCLPIKPLLPGFALDTALYAFAWYLLLFTPLPLYRFARRRSRLSKGLCPTCAYDLKGSPSGPCPECGA